MSGKILVTDDEAHILRVVKDKLEKVGYNVITAANGREALEKVKNEKPDLMVLDIFLPELDGYEVMRKVKDDPETRELPIIVLSIVADEECTKNYGGDAYISKPFKLKELTHQIENLLCNKCRDKTSGISQF